MAKIFESPDKGKTVYAREIGAEPNTRIEIEHTFDPRTGDGRPLREHILEDKLWGEIRREAMINPTLQAELERVKMIYYLIKKDNTVAYHPV